MILIEGLAVTNDLFLNHNHSYYIVVVSADKMGRCSASVSSPVTVDTTPPHLGQVKVEGGRNKETVLFIQDDRLLRVNLEEYWDVESGIEISQVQLFQSTVSRIPSSFC